MIGKDKVHRATTLLLAIFASLLMTSTAYALGTTSNTDIDNTATVNYNIGATPQTLIESSPLGNSTPGAGNGTATTFKVDNRIDFTVAEADTTYSQTTSGATLQAVAFTLQNDGNTVQDFSFTATELSSGTGDPFGGTDNFDGTGGGIFVEDGTTPGFQPAEDTATYVDELAEDASITVYVVRDIPGGQVDGDISGVTLEAQVAQGGAPGAQGADILTDDSLSADDPATVQIVFADGAGDNDGANDGVHSDTDAYIVVSATLTITKTSTVVSDPINLAVNPKAIPGATVEYTITVANALASTGTASNVTVTDDISTEVGLGTIVFDLNGYGAVQGLQVTAPNINGGAALSLTNAGDVDEGTWNAGANTLTVNGITIAPGESATVNYRVTIQ